MTMAAEAKQYHVGHKIIARWGDDTLRTLQAAPVTIPSVAPRLACRFADVAEIIEVRVKADEKGKADCAVEDMPPATKEYYVHYVDCEHLA